MKVFVGYGYNPRDAWVESLVFPLIKAFGHEPTHGKETFGQILDKAVVYEIEGSDAMFAFRTRRDEADPATGLFRTHPWVDDELLTVVDLKKNHSVCRDSRDEGRGACRESSTEVAEHAAHSLR